MTHDSHHGELLSVEWAYKKRKKGGIYSSRMGNIIGQCAEMERDRRPEVCGGRTTNSRQAYQRISLREAKHTYMERTARRLLHGLISASVT